MLNPCAARQLLATQGERVRWLEALPCDCRDPGDPTSYDRTCKACSFGYVYRERTLPANVKALVHSERRSFLHAEFGYMSMGDLYITTMVDELPLGDFDRVVLVERRRPKKEQVRRGSEGVADPLAEEFPVAVLAVTDADTVFVEGVDWNFAGGGILWLPGGARPGRSVYAVHYQYAPVYWYTGSGMTAARPLPGGIGSWPQTGRLEIKHPLEE